MSLSKTCNVSNNERSIKSVDNKVLFNNISDVHRQTNIVSALAKIVISIFRLGEKAMEDMVEVRTVIHHAASFLNSSTVHKRPSNYMPSTAPYVQYRYSRCEVHSHKLYLLFQITPKEIRAILPSCKGCQTVEVHCVPARSRHQAVVPRQAAAYRAVEATSR